VQVLLPTLLCELWCLLPPALSWRDREFFGARFFQEFGIQTRYKEQRINIMVIELVSGETFHYFDRTAAFTGKFPDEDGENSSLHRTSTVNVKNKLINTEYCTQSAFQFFFLFFLIFVVLLQP
jgi:hypothetical protein